MEFSKEELELIKKQKIEYKSGKAKMDSKFTVFLNMFSSYGRDIARYMKFWAKAMQYLIKEKGYSVADAAKETEIECCSAAPGLTGCQVSIATGELIKNWKYGDELGKWHNKERGFVDTIIVKD